MIILIKKINGKIATFQGFTFYSIFWSFAISVYSTGEEQSLFKQSTDL